MCAFILGVEAFASGFSLLVFYGSCVLILILKTNYVIVSYRNAMRFMRSAILRRSDVGVSTMRS